MFHVHHDIVFKRIYHRPRRRPIEVELQISLLNKNSPDKLSLVHKFTQIKDKLGSPEI